MHLKLPNPNAYPNRQEEVAFQHGAVFAVGGSTIRNRNMKNEKSYISLDGQIEEFTRSKSG